MAATGLILSSFLVLSLSVDLFFFEERALFIPWVCLEAAEKAV